MQYPCPFLALERLNPSTLASQLRATSHSGLLHFRPFSLPRLLSLMCQLTSAIDYLHMGLPNDVSIIHRDLKPDNIGFTASGVIKIMDFGLSTCINRSVSTDEAYDLSGGTGSLRLVNFYSSSFFMNSDISNTHDGQ